ncbi:enoyl-CoA hydratase [Gordonia amarae]|uniref:Enoyl-CoA hydratase n=2 Tax=Gordonia amarae TaxID=36821 RepID=A0A857MEK6_9ACTN|nr:enoyl-CoA hydratase-related protein [Gordonia amarae]MCS3880473.1 enoyl-CoA hydratase [Gordonia amarae]QHN18803.1 enoyl-CoA hydratase [Gordonia amarae]QHN23278.1 enoyl-CoA hydratase [Gordonia amarae]QHN32179.1 enoyl-CoA hydratase [Gordonia amarae]QHN40926.1 enoyl-CoA hydratase [Gordonia amarae]
MTAAETEQGGDAPALLAELDGQVLVLTLNRPDQRNAINRAMRKELKRQLWRADSDDDIRAVVITGAGPSFSSGVDLPEALSGPSPRTEGPTPTQVLRACSKPVIAAVNGACYTGGFELAVNCSFIIASEKAVFADTHAQIGLLNGWGGSALLPRTVGLAAAIQIILSGEPFDAATALRLGLANEVVPHEQHLERTMTIARTIAGGHPGAVQRMLRLLKEGAGASVTHALALEEEARVAFRTSSTDIGARYGNRRKASAES